MRVARDSLGFTGDSVHGVSRCVLPCLVITAVSFSLAFGDAKFFDFAGVRDQRVIAFDMRGAREERQTSRSARHGSAAKEFESSSVSYRTMVLTHSRRAIDWRLTAAWLGIRPHGGRRSAFFRIFSPFLQDS